MSVKDNVDFSSFTGDGNFDLFSNSIRKAFSYDSYGDKSNFQAVVISQPIPLNPNDSQFFLGKDSVRSTKVSRFSYRARIIGADSPHKFLPDPCNPNYTGDANATNEIIALHTTFFSSGEVGVDELLPLIGSLVEVRLDKNSFSYNLSRGAHLKVVKNPSESSAATSTCDSIAAIMSAAGAAESLGSTGAGTAIIQLTNSLPDITAEDGVISGASLDALTPVVEKELALWSGKKETEEQMYSTLKKYWDNLGVTEWTPAGVPWSAAFISWGVGQADPGFPKSAGHYFYAQAAQKGSGGWSAWKAGSAKIKAQVGDILVRPRTGAGASNTSSHGDVVFKIENNKAFLAGGNLGNSARIEAELSIDSEGNYTSYQKYIVVLKKNGSVNPPTSA